MSAQALTLLIVSAAVGYWVAKFFAGKDENTQGRLPSIIFHVQGYTVHIHHWVWGSLILVLLLAVQFRSAMVYGLLIGIILQGLGYRNRFQIIYRA